jgi:hypothetical protein
MLRAGHRLDERFTQTGEIVFGSGRKWWGPMAKAIGVKSGDLDAYIRNDWTPEEVDQINAFLAGLLDDAALHAAIYASRNRADAISYLAAQYRAPRHRPVVEHPDTQEFIQQCDASELELPKGALAGLEELLADD